MELVITDQVSTDGSRELIRKFLSENVFPGDVRFIESSHNTGFAGGHNRVMAMSGAEYIFCVNPDIIIEPDFLEKALRPFFKDEKIGAVQPKLLRYNFKKRAPATHDGKNIIDTTGLLLLKNRRIINRGQGYKDIGQFEKEEEVFGADGAAPVYRKKTLEDVKVPLFDKEGRPIDGKFEYFDEDFVAYKEDVDLAWRMRMLGWKTLYNPEAVAYHGRGSGESAALDYAGIIRERRKISKVAKKLAFRNQRFMQLKNEYWGAFLKHLPILIVKEILAWGYVLVFEISIFLETIPELIRGMAKMLRKRKYIMGHKRSSDKYMEGWFK
jgi:GT2 family glycosyltransferase